MLKIFIMKIFITILITLISIPVFASQYGVYTPENYAMKPEEGERILFILDFSNSMNETLDGRSKVDTMLDTMKQIIPKLSPNTSVGLRVYGHKMGFTPIDACRASSLIVPISRGGGGNISNALYDVEPRGMTPITFSLKEAVRKDFLGFSGKKHIILLTDGGENCDESPCKWVMELVKIRKDVVIDVIAFNIRDEDDLAQLECTSLVTGGKFYTANTAAELARGLNNSVNAQKEVEARIIPNY